MSPEQARGHTVDPRCDIFALGLIAYRTLTGRPAFSDKDPVRLIVSIARDQPLAPGLGEQIDVVLALALAKDPSQRFTTVARFAEALAQAARGELSPALLSCGRALLCAHPWRQHRHDAPLETPPLGDATTELGTELLPTAQLHEAIALS